MKRPLVQRKLNSCYIDTGYEKSDKSIWRLLNIRCTRSVQLLSEVLVQIGKHSRIIKTTKNTIITRREMFL